MVTDAQSAGLAHEEPGDALPVAGPDERADFVGSAATLHHYRLQPGVESPGREEALHGGSEELSRGVVDVGLE